MTNVHFALKSRNAKTGPIPVSTSEAKTCPAACTLKDEACYAELGHVGMHWRKVTSGARGNSWDAFLEQVRALPEGQLFRHNQAGDLPGLSNAIDTAELTALVDANAGRRGFTYTHKPMTSLVNREAVRKANAEGFTINLSANHLAEADELAALGIAPVVVVLPSDQVTATKTPAGRSVAICPATISDDVTCASCGICALRDRKAIIGFPAHGISKAKASRIAAGPAPIARAA